MIGKNGRSRGTGAMYWARTYKWNHCKGDYDIALGDSSLRKECSDALEREVVVIFGEDISMNDAIILLRQLTNKIKKWGLYTGGSRDGVPKFDKKVIQI